MWRGRYGVDAAASDGTAIYKVGWLYDNGLGVPQDYNKAMEWYRKDRGYQ